MPENADESGGLRNGFKSVAFWKQNTSVSGVDELEELEKGGFESGAEKRFRAF